MRTSSLLFVSVALLLVLGSVEAGRVIEGKKKSNVAVGPIQKVLELLDSLKAKIIAEGEVEGEQFEKYTAWCAEETDVKEDAIKFGTDRVAALNAEIEQLSGEVATLATEIETVANEIAVNEKDLEAATEIRNKERETFEAGDKDLTETVDMLVRAKSVLKKQLMFTQTGKGQHVATRTLPKEELEEIKQVAQGISTILDAAFVNAEDRKKLSAFVQSQSDEAEDDMDEDLQPAGAPAPEAYKSHSKGILDVLDELQDKAETEQSELRKKEMNAKHAFEMLEQSLTDSIEHSNEALEASKASSSAKKEAIGIASGDLAVATKTLAEDKKYLENVGMMCQQKASEWEMRKKSRAKELKALEEAKAILSKKFSLLSGEEYGMIQVAHRSRREDDNRQAVADYLDGQAQKLHSVALSQLATRFRDGDDPFAKVKGMIQEMIDRLVQEAAEEADHKAYCDEETGKSKKSREKHQDRVDVLSGRIAKADAAVDKLKNDVAALQKEVAQMNKAEAEATEQRQAEKEEYEKNIKDYSESMEALSAAIEVLQEMYGGAKAALVEEGQDPEFGGPVFSGEYQKQDGSGIIGLLEVAQSDFSKMDAEAKADEAAAKKEYETLVQDNAVSRATKEADIKGKTAEVGRLETSLKEMNDDRKSSQKELDAVLEYLDKLKEACEVKPESYEERKRRRRAEIDSLREALAILSGEDVAAPSSAFLQVKRHTTQAQA